MTHPNFSVVIPVYQCSRCLRVLCSRLHDVLTALGGDFEIILINDNSPDDSWARIIELAAEDPRVKGISLSRNFGQHHAITAGLDCARGDWVVVMDCDLQDQPEEITRLYRKAIEGYEVVLGRRIQRRDTAIKRFSSRLFYRIFDYFTDQHSDFTVANFGIYSRKVVAEFQRLREHNRFFPLFVRWLGFRSTAVEIEHASRDSGRSSYPLRKLMGLAANVIIAHSNKPLRLSIAFGFAMALLSMLYGLYLIVRYFVYGVPVEGWTSVMVSIYLLSGLLFANLGILGLYIGKVFDETKKRPLYVIDQMINLSDRRPESQQGRIA